MCNRRKLRNQRICETVYAFSIEYIQQYALQARKHIATLRKARPGIIIEIRWCLAHKGVAGNEKADEWAKIAAEEPDARGVEWLSYSDRNEARAMPLPRFLAHLKREITEKK